MAEATKEEDWVTVKTTLPTMPIASNAERVAFSTERLVVRPLKAEDIHDVYVLRTQPEVMISTALGKGDADLAASQARLDLHLPPNDVTNYHFAIVVKETSEFIGMGGVHQIKGDFGWPVVGYMLRKECWGKGFATEAMRAILELYAKLPRSEVERRVRKATVPEGAETVEEMLAAVTENSNALSKKVLTKLGFECVYDWTEPDLHFPDDPTKLVTLNFHRIFPGRLLKN